jgi:NitT/TauT family transport system substrate-binding protein
MIDSAGSYPDAKVVDGWIANNQWYSGHQGTVRKLIRAWLAANASFRSDPEGALKKVYDTAYTQDAKLSDLQHQVKYQTDYSNAEWRRRYESGQVLDWVGQAERAFVELGGVPEYVNPRTFFDTSLFVDEAKQAGR